MKPLFKRALWLGCVVIAAIILTFSLVSCGEENYARNPKKDIPLLCEIINSKDLITSAERFFEDAEISQRGELSDFTFVGSYNGESLTAASVDGFVTVTKGTEDRYFVMKDGYAGEVSFADVLLHSYLSEMKTVSSYIEELLSAEYAQLLPEHLSESDGYYLLDGDFLREGLADAASVVLHDYLGKDVTKETVSALLDAELKLGVKSEKLGAVLLSLSYDADKVSGDAMAENAKRIMKTVKSFDIQGSLMAEDDVIFDKLTVTATVKFFDGSCVEFTENTRLGYDKEGDAKRVEHTLSAQLSSFFLADSQGETVFAPSAYTTEGYRGDGSIYVDLSVNKTNLSASDVAKLSVSYGFDNIKYIRSGVPDSSGEKFDSVNGKRYEREISLTVGEVDIAAGRAKLSLEGNSLMAGVSESFTLSGAFGEPCQSNDTDGFALKVKDNCERLSVLVKRYYTLTNGSIYPYSTAGHPFGYYAFYDEQTKLYICYSKFIYSVGESTPESFRFTEVDPSVSSPDGNKYIIVTMVGDTVTPVGQ